MKRLLSDHENQLLDRVRRDRKAKTAEALLDQIDTSDGIEVLLDGDLAEAADAGVESLRRNGVEPGGLDYKPLRVELSEQLGESFVATIERRLSKIIDETQDDTTDRTELVGRIRAVYREWRAEELQIVAGDAVTSAFNGGILSAAPAGSKLRWVVDNGGLASPDCEDNALAGALSPGDTFPTGCTRPSAHPGCRCLLVPADS